MNSYNIGGWSFGGQNGQQQTSPWVSGGDPRLSYESRQSRALRWYTEYSRPQSPSVRGAQSLGRLEAIDEDLPGPYQPLERFSSHRPGTFANQAYSRSADDIRGTPSLYDTYNFEEDNSSPKRGPHSGRRNSKDNGKKDSAKEKKGKVGNRRFSEGSVPSYSSGGFYNAYEDSSNPRGQGIFPGGPFLPTISGAVAGPYGRRASCSDADVRSQTSSATRGRNPRAKPKKESDSTGGNSSVKDGEGSSRGGGASSTGTTKNNNNKNNINHSKNINGKNLNTNDEPPGKLQNKTNNNNNSNNNSNIKRSESNDDIVSSVLSASGRGGQQTTTLTIVGPGGRATILDIPSVQSTKSRLRNLVSPITTFLVVVAMLVALTVAVYFAVAMKESQEEQIEILQAQLEMRVAESNAARDFSRLTSSEQEALKAAHCRQIDELYARSALSQEYRGCEVTILTNERIQFKIYFVDTPKAAKQEDAIVEVLAREATSTGKEGEKILKINDIQLDISEKSRSVQLETTLKDQDFYGADSRKEVKDTNPPQAPVRATSTLPATAAAAAVATTTTTTTEDDEKAINQTVLNQDICNATNSVMPVAHPYSCSHYIQCAFNQSIVRQCAGGLVFDPNTVACVKPTEDLPCREIKPCRDLNGGYFAHPTNCRLYVICDQGKSKVMSCGEQVWDEVSKNCLPRKRGTSCDMA